MNDVAGAYRHSIDHHPGRSRPASRCARASAKGLRPSRPAARHAPPRCLGCSVGQEPERAGRLQHEGHNISDDDCSPRPRSHRLDHCDHRHWLGAISSGRFLDVAEFILPGLHGGTVCPRRCRIHPGGDCETHSAPQLRRQRTDVRPGITSSCVEHAQGFYRVGHHARVEVESILTLARSICHVPSSAAADLSEARAQLL